MQETEVFCHHAVQVTNLCSVISVIITADKLWIQGSRSCQFCAKIDIFKGNNCLSMCICDGKALECQSSLKTSDRIYHRLVTETCVNYVKWQTNFFI